MSFTDIFKKIFGTKADRDMKAIKPMLDKVLEAYETAVKERYRFFSFGDAMLIV